MAIKYRDTVKSDREREIESMTKRLADASLSDRVRAKIGAQLARLEAMTDDQFTNGGDKGQATIV
jgi:hypothetical protein